MNKKALKRAILVWLAVALVALIFMSVYYLFGDKVFNVVLGVLFGLGLFSVFFYATYYLLDNTNDDKKYYPPLIHPTTPRPSVSPTPIKPTPPQGGTGECKE